MTVYQQNTIKYIHKTMNKTYVDAASLILYKAEKNSTQLLDTYV